MALADEIRNLRARQAANEGPRRGATPKPMNPRVAASLNLPTQASNISLEQAIQALAAQAPSGGGRQLQTGGPIEFQQLRELQAAQERAQRAAQLTGGGSSNTRTIDPLNRGLPDFYQQPGALQADQERAQRAREMFLAQQAAQQQIKQQMQQQMQQQMPGQFTSVPFGSMPTGNPYLQRGMPIGFQNPAMLQNAQDRAIRAGSGFMNSFGLFGQPNMAPQNAMAQYPVGGPMPQPNMGQQPQSFGANMGQQYATAQPNMNQQYGGNPGFPMTNMGQQQQPQSTNAFDSFAYRPL